MRTLYGTLLALSLVLLIGPAQAEDKVDLKVGDPAPVFTATDEQGNTFKSSDVVGKEYLVIFFYPGALTGGCTRQACTFRDEHKQLADKGIRVVGVSGDKVASQQLFKEKNKLPFTLLADEEGKVAGKFGVPFKKGGTSKVKGLENQDLTLQRGVTAQRWTFVIGKDGKILYKNTKVSPAEDAKQVLEAVSKGN